MVYIDTESLTNLIDKNKQYIKNLKDLQEYSKDDFLSDWKIYSLVDRYLHLALESMLDIGKKIINQMDFKKPDRYTEIFKILSENKIIPRDKQAKYEELAKFRNALVHDYLYLDHEKIYKHLQEDIKYLEAFLEYIKNFLKNKK